MKRHHLKKPTGRRKTFGLYLQEIKPDGSTCNETLKHQDIEAINAKYKSKEYSLKQATHHASLVRDRLNVECGADPKPEQTNLYNMQALDSYWKNEYSYRELKDESSAWNKLRRAVVAIGNLSLITSSRGELQMAIKNLNRPQSVKREITSSLNQLLKYSKRDFTLRLPKKDLKPVPDHLTEEEFLQVAPVIENESVKVAAYIAFYAGVRLGELLAISSTGILEDGRVVFVPGQIDKTMKLVKGKTGSRPAFIHEAGRPWLALWDQHKEACLELKHVRMTKILKVACRKVFPNDPSKHCTFNDLRHSYAVGLIPKIGYDLTAQTMGNSSRVVQDHYAGLNLSKQGISAIEMRLKEAKEKV